MKKSDCALTLNGILTGTVIGMLASTGALAAKGGGVVGSGSDGLILEAMEAVRKDVVAPTPDLNTHYGELVVIGDNGPGQYVAHVKKCELDEKGAITFQGCRFDEGELDLNQARWLPVGRYMITYSHMVAWVEVQKGRRTEVHLSKILLPQSAEGAYTASVFRDVSRPEERAKELDLLYFGYLWEHTGIPRDSISIRVTPAIHSKLVAAKRARDLEGVVVRFGAKGYVEQARLRLPSEYVSYMLFSGLMEAERLEVTKAPAGGFVSVLPGTYAIEFKSPSGVTTETYGLQAGSPDDIRIVDSANPTPPADLDLIRDLQKKEEAALRVRGEAGFAQDDYLTTWTYAAGARRLQDVWGIDPARKKPLNFLKRAKTEVPYSPWDDVNWNGDYQLVYSNSFHRLRVVNGRITDVELKKIQLPSGKETRFEIFVDLEDPSMRKTLAEVQWSSNFLGSRADSVCERLFKTPVANPESAAASFCEKRKQLRLPEELLGSQIVSTGAGGEVTMRDFNPECDTELRTKGSFPKFWKRTTQAAFKKECRVVEVKQRLIVASGIKKDGDGQKDFVSVLPGVYGMTTWEKDASTGRWTAERTENGIRLE